MAKLIKLITVVALLILAAVLVGGVTLLTNERATRWAIQQLNAWGGDQIHVVDIGGTLAHMLTAKSLKLNTKSATVEATAAQIDWDARALLSRTLHVRKVQIDRLDIHMKPNPKSDDATLPQSLVLPLAMNIDSLQVNHLSIYTAGKAFEFSGVQVELNAVREYHALNLRIGGSPLGPMEAKVKLGTDTPFALAGHLDLRAVPGPRPLVAQGVLSGSLQALQTKWHVNAAGAIVEGEATLLPVQRQPLRSAAIQWRGLRPSEWIETAVAAELSGSAKIAVEPDSQMTGSLMITNHGTAGPVDHDRVPFKSLSANLAGQWPTLQSRGLRIDLGPAGHADGQLEFRAQALQAQLTTNALNLQGLKSDLLPTALKGQVELDGNQARQVLALDFTQVDKRIAMNLTHAHNLITLTSARLSTAGGKAELHGQVNLAGNKEFNAEGRALHFNPSEFGTYPQADINAELSGAGRLAPDPQGALDFKLRDSTWRGQPLSGHGHVGTRDSDTYAVDIALMLARNKLNASGDWGPSRGLLIWQLQAPDLNVLDPNFSGVVDAKGEIAGGTSQPRGHMELSAADLNVGKKFLSQSVKGRLALGEPARDTVAGNFEVQGLQQQRLRVDRARLTLQGRMGSHELTMNAQGPMLDLSTKVQGALRDRKWKGQVMQLTNNGTYKIQLITPATVEVSKDNFQLGTVRLDTGIGHAEIDHVHARGEAWSTKGLLHELSLAQLLAIYPMRAIARTDLLVNGSWDLRGERGQMRGDAQLSRSSGDVILRGEQPLPLQLTAANVHARLQSKALQFNATLAGKEVGQVELDGTSDLRAATPRQSPVNGRLKIDMPSIAWLRAIKEDIDADGATQVEIAMKGTLGEPLLTGTVSGSNLQLAMPEEGLALSAGTVQARLHDQRLYIDKLSVKSGKGDLAAQGAIALDNRPTDLRYQLRTFTAISRPDREVVVSGEGAVLSRSSELLLEGNVNVDRGTIELAANDGRELSKDIVVIESGAEQNSPKPVHAKTPVRLKIALDLGQDFRIQGRGIKTELEGKLNVRAASGKRPRLFGTVYAKNGSVKQYGQELSVEQGAVSFNGPVDDPALSIVARRKRQETGWLADDEVDVSVRIAGTASKPRVTLVSTPPVPDSEKLAWLILGHGLQGSQRNEIDALAAAAGALLSGDDSGSMQAKLANAIGVEELGMRRDNVQQQTFATLGKRLSSRAYLILEQALGGASSLAKLRYKLTGRWSLQATAGTESALDLFYNWRFD